MTRDRFGAPPHHRVPADIRRSVSAAVLPVVIGVAAAVALVAGAGATSSTVLLAVGVVLLAGWVGYAWSDRISDSHRWQQAEKRRRGVA